MGVILQPMEFPPVTIVSNNFKIASLQSQRGSLSRSFAGHDWNASQLTLFRLSRRGTPRLNPNPDVIFMLL